MRLFLILFLSRGSFHNGIESKWPRPPGGGPDNIGLKKCFCYLKAVLKCLIFVARILKIILIYYSKNPKRAIGGFIMRQQFSFLGPAKYRCLGCDCYSMMKNEKKAEEEKTLCPECGASYSDFELDSLDQKKMAAS